MDCLENFILERPCLRKFVDNFYWASYRQPNLPCPKQAYEALTRFKDNSWKALNSYAHAGIHPIRRHHDGYPLKLIHDVLRNTNGLAVMSCMHAVMLSGQQPLQRTLMELAGKRSECMPAPI